MGSNEVALTRESRVIEQRAKAAATRMPRAEHSERQVKILGTGLLSASSDAISNDSNLSSMSRPSVADAAGKQRANNLRRACASAEADLLHPTSMDGSKIFPLTSIHERSKCPDMGGYTER